MRTLPKLVAQTEVGKRVELKVWRNQKLISKKVLLGRLESSKEFKQGNKKPETEIETLKIKVREVNEEDIQKRGLSKKLKGVVVVEISNDSPLIRLLSVNDIILGQAVQRKCSSSLSLEERASTMSISGIILEKAPLYKKGPP